MTKFHISPIAIELLMHSHVSNQPFANYRSDFLFKAAVNYCFQHDLLKLSDKIPEVFDTTDKGRALIRMFTQIDVEDFLGDLEAKKTMPRGQGQTIETFSISRGLSDLVDTSKPLMNGPIGKVGLSCDPMGTKHGLNEHEEIMQKRRADRDAEARGEIPSPSTHPMLGN